MCGIAGVFNFQRDRPGDAAAVARLNDHQSRRGPDGSGLWSSDDKRVVFGHRRLAIIDLGPSGAQPMSDAAGRWTVTFNGEIYNYRELRAELTALGCRFATGSDTEVLIQAIATWGEAGLPRLRGMFAFALWDNLKRELWLARDPYGIKPLYVAEHNGSLWFASQARALAEAAPLQTSRDAAALVSFYLLGHVAEPYSWWSGITMFPAGHVQRLSAARFGAPSAYQCVEETLAAAQPRPMDTVELRKILADSVRHHLVADTPVGVFLSAGVDSTAVATLAAELGTALRTITLAFDEYAGGAEDEAPLAEATAKVLRSDHMTVRVGREEFESLVDDFLAEMDQPSIDGLNTYLVSRAASSQGLKVALSGLGGDELFGGYPSFRQIPKLLSLGRYVPAGVADGIGRLLRLLPLPGVPPKMAGLFSYSRDTANAWLLRRSLFLADELDMLMDESWLLEGLERLGVVRALRASLQPVRTLSCHAQVAVLESCWYMRNQLLRDTDWASMAHGVEVRVPFVDAHLLARLAPAIVSAYPPSKTDMGRCVGILPQVLARAKTGFTTPVRDWAAEREAISGRGLRGWAQNVHARFRGVGDGRASGLAGGAPPPLWTP